MNNRYLTLCLVTNLQTKSFTSYQSFILKAIQGGVTSIQLREKNSNLDEVYHLALALKRLLAPFKIPLIINDHVCIARQVKADGVHIGQSDISPQEARKILGPEAIIGLSIETFDELEKANQLSCIDYVGASAIFPSKTKPNCKTIWGLDGLRQFTELSHHPAMAIGGIKHQNIVNVINSGAAGVAVIGAIHDAPDPALATSTLIDLIDETMTRRNNNVRKYR